MAENWWDEAVIYEVYVRSFADSNGDGVGDLCGVIEHLDHLVSLGVDGLWLTPFYPSPMADHGYDVADPRAVEPVFGNLADFDALASAAHRRGLRLVVDVVPNHTSSHHPWFRSALATPAGSLERARYVFADGRGPGGTSPPNNWRSVFGGPAWSRVRSAAGDDRQWYLHLFAPEQPDLNWSHPDVLDDLRGTLRFWRERGVDGFRIDVAHGLAKAPGLPDMQGDAGILAVTADDPRFDQPAVHAIWREVRHTLDEIGAIAVGEVWVDSQQSLARYVRDDELNLAFDFRLLLASWDPAALRAAVAGGLAVNRRTWAVENHDRDRLSARYGGGATGAARARAMSLLMLALPGSVYLYQGQELGLPQVDIAPQFRQDPVWERSGHRQAGRDGCRVPLPWTGQTPPYGFSAPGSEAPWLPMPTGWGPMTVQAQTGRPDSTLALHRAALSARQKLLVGQDFGWLPAPEGVLAFRRGPVVCVLNAGSAAARLDHAELGLRGQVRVVPGLASHAGQGTAADPSRLPPDAAMWLVADVGDTR